MNDIQKEATFADLKLNENIMRAITAANYEKPSPIQAKAIPAILEGRDIFGCAQTGTGKTAAFALPIMQKLEESGHFPQPKQFRALILTPTRELAEQISTNITQYGKFLKIRQCKVYGGVSQGPQVKTMSKGVDILVATPGRLLDLFKQKALKFDGVEFLVLDEADRMLDMGFLPDVRRICAELPKQRQSLLFSATLTDDIEELARAIVKDPLKITISPDKPTVDKIAQSVAYVEIENKIKLLETVMTERVQNNTDARTLIFCRTKHGANKLSKRLYAMGFEADAIHGNKSQSARQSALNRFKNHETQVLVATDIAARGIDVKDMTLVINYDLPEDPETYVHRIGRTARAEADGAAISFCSTMEVPLLKAVENFIKKSISEYAPNPYHSDNAKAKSVLRVTRAQIAETKRALTGGNRGNGRKPQSRGGRDANSQGGRPTRDAPNAGKSPKSPKRVDVNFYGESAPKKKFDAKSRRPDASRKSSSRDDDVSTEAARKSRKVKMQDFRGVRREGAKGAPKKETGDSFWRSLRAKFAKKRPNK